MLIFNYVEFKNIQAYGNVITRLELNEGMRTLIIATNGNGKSTIVNVMSYVLFNKSFTGGKLTNARMINSINKKDMYVKIEFVNSGKIYQVERGLKATIFNIYVDGVLVAKLSTVDDYQQYLERDILKLTFDAFKQIIVLSKVNYNAFMKLTTPKRREVIDALLDIEIFSKMLSLLKLRITDNSLSLQQNAKDIKAEEEKIKLIESHIKSLDEEFEGKNDKIRSEIKIFEEIIIERLNDLALFKAKITELKSKKDKLLVFVKTDEKLRNKIAEIDREIDKCHNEQHLSGICATCNQEISNNIIEKEQLKNKKQISILELEQLKIEGQLEQLSVGIEQLKILNIEVETFEKHERETNQQIELHHYKIQVLNEQINKKSYDKDKLLSSVEILNKKLEELLRNKEKLLIEKEIHNTSTVILRDNGIKATVIKTYIPEFNRLINQYLSDMNAFYSFELDENFDETINSRYRDEFVYDNFSAGEQQRIDLAILFTWREIAKSRNSMSTNLVIFDEVLDGSLDGEGIDDLLKILVKITGSIFIISHSTDMLEYFNRVLKVEKVNNFSEINDNS